jgi:nicotinate-nucleotide adenylyltransferase
MKRLGVLPGTFNPVTRAHVAMAQSALNLVDEVVFVLPREFPHKQYSGASFEDRVALLGAVAAGEPRFSVATPERGLFIDIAAELRAERGSETRLSFICGRDAAERIVGWDYGERAALIEILLREFDWLVAARDGEYTPPPEIARWVEPLPLDEEFQRMSATQVRERIGRGEPWEHLVPPAIHREVERIYGSSQAPE